MVEQSEKKQRGGKREGAGRPGSNSKLYTFRAPGYLTDYIDGQQHKTAFFKDCIIRRMQADTEGMEQLGDLYPADRVKGLTLPYFDIGLVAGFPNSTR